MNAGALSVLHFSTADNQGGSGRAAYRIHTGLKALGHASRMLVGTKITSDRDVEVVHGGGMGRLADRLADVISQRVGLQYAYFPSGKKVLNHPWLKETDIIQLYNTHGGYFSQRLLPRLSRQAPIVWRLSDLWPMTGHCAYPGPCERWKIGCGHCPDLATYPGIPVDTTAYLWREKKRLYHESDITIVAPSGWIEDIARQSPLFAGFPIYRIPSGIDVDVFRPRERAAMRAFLDIPTDAKVLVFSAHVLDDNPRKGAEHLIEALQRIGEQAGWMLLLAGVGGESWQDKLPLPVRTLGFIGEDRMLAAAYASADLVVAPSVLENMPNSVLEGMACGIPAVAFDTGGMRDAVRHLETGYLARHGDAKDLEAGIRQLMFDDELRARLGGQARAMIEREFSKEIQAKRFAELYRETLDRSRRVRT